MFALRRLAVNAARCSNTVAPVVVRIARPRNLGELQIFERSIVQQQRCFGQEGYESQHFRRQGRGPRREPRDAPSEPTKVIYVGNIKFDATEEELRELFAQYGTVVGVRFPTNPRDGGSRGFAYVEYENIEQAGDAIANCHQFEFGGRRLNVQYTERRELPTLNNEPSRTLFVGNLPYNCTDQDLQELFKGIDGVLDVRVALDRRSGSPRGFVHADFENTEAAVAAKEKLTGTELHGRVIRLDYSKPQESSSAGAA